jgi:hypothetical protein
MNPSIAQPHDGIEPDEVGHLLDALRNLARNASSPPVPRLCLEETRKDIAHLAGVDDPYQTASEAEAA